MQDALKEQGKSSVILSLDGWLRAPQERGSNVLERYDISTLLDLIQNSVGRTQAQVLTVPIYSKTDKQKQHVIQKQITPKDIVILEGTIALHLENLVKLASASSKATAHRYYVTMDEALRKVRVLAEYALRGKSSAQAEQVYAQRLQDEIPYLEADQSTATHVIDLELK
jgi:pantothenate kinase